MKNLLAGHVLAAFEWNPLVFLSVIGLALYALYAAAVTTLRLPRIRLDSFSPAEIQFLRLAVALLVAANWIYLLFHFSHGA